MILCRRGNAIRLLIDTGGRLSENSDLAVTDVDFDAGVCYAIGNGRRARPLPDLSRATREECSAGVACSWA
jgi:integrase